MFRRLLWMCAVPFLLIACASDRVVVKPIAPPKVAPELLRPVAKPICELTPGASEYSPAEIAATIDCWRSAWAVAAGKHERLAKAVRVREAKVAEAVKASIR